MPTFPWSKKSPKPSKNPPPQPEPKIPTNPNPNQYPEHVSQMQPQNNGYHHFPPNNPQLHGHHGQNPQVHNVQDNHLHNHGHQNQNIYGTVGRNIPAYGVQGPNMYNLGPQPGHNIQVFAPPQTQQIHDQHGHNAHSYGHPGHDNGSPGQNHGFPDQQIQVHSHGGQHSLHVRGGQGGGGRQPEDPFYRRGSNTSNSSKHCDRDTLEWRQWLENAKAEFERKWASPSLNNAAMQDFDLQRTVGVGTFGRVIVVQHKRDRQFYAMKILSKRNIVKRKQIDNTITEKNLLAAMNFPFLVGLRYHFKDSTNVYMVMEYISGGEMFRQLQKSKHFTEARSKFYAAQIVLAFEYLHSFNVIYRDLKPENILICPDGYLKLTDFGFAKRVGQNGRTWTLCGTPEYLAPEIILTKGYNKAVDWWTLGILVYEMTTGCPPFYADQPMKIYERVVSGKPPHYPAHFTTDLKDLIKRLLQIDLTRRFGNLKNGVDDIKGHPWFNKMDWIGVFLKEVEPPFKPDLSGPGDTKNFDEYKEEELQISPVDKYAREFENF